MHLCQNKTYMDKTHNNLYLLKKNGFQSRNGLSKAQACLLYAVCACNYIHLPLARQHKPSIFVSRFVPSRHFFTCNQLSGGAFPFENKPQMNDGCGLRVQIVFIKKMAQYMHNWTKTD